MRFMSWYSKINILQHFCFPCVLKKFCWWKMRDQLSKKHKLGLNGWVLADSLERTIWNVLAVAGFTFPSNFYWFKICPWCYRYRHWDPQVLLWFPIAGWERFQHPIPVLKSQESHQTPDAETVQSNSVIFTRCVQNTHQSIIHKDCQEEENGMSSTSESGGNFNEGIFFASASRSGEFPWPMPVSCLLSLEAEVWTGFFSSQASFWGGKIS